MPFGQDPKSFDRARLWLYANKYWKTEKHPVKTGPGEISKLALRRIVEAAKNTEEDVIRLRCASWERTSAKGNEYTYVTLEPEERREEAVSVEPTPPREEEIEEDVPF